MTDKVEVTELTREEGIRLFDSICHEELHCSGEDFLYMHDHGYLYPGWWSHDAIMRVEILIPFAREVPSE